MTVIKYHLIRELIFVVIMATWSCLPAQVLATDYFVARDGKDSNSGTDSSVPYASLAKATSVMTAGDTCFVRGGTYRETLTVAQSGTTLLPITFTAYSNEVVTISAADVLTNWSLCTNTIYQAPMGWDLGEGFNQVFVDGVMMVQARYPNLGSADLLHPPLADMTTTNTTSVNCSALTQTNDFWKGGILVGGFYERWSFQCAKITSSVPGTLYVNQVSYPWFIKGANLNGGQGYITGVPGALDTTNEWHYAAGTLYLWAPDSGSPAGHLVEAKRRSWCIDFNGQSNVVVRGLKCFAGAIRMNSNYDRLENCEAQYLSHFTHFTWSGYSGGGGAESGHSGITISGKFNEIRNCRIAWSAGSGIVLNGSSNLVTRTTIHDVNYSGTYACPIYMFGTGHEVSFNTLYNTGRDILTGAPRGANIHHNDCFNSGLLCRDLGVVYFGFSDGAGTRIAYNWIHDNQEGGPNGPGIYLDNYGRNYIVDHNVIWNCPNDDGIRINRPAYSNLVYNNTLFACDNIGTWTYDQWPYNNPDTNFWTSDLYQYSNTNNLYLGSSPAAQLQDATNRDFRLKAGAAAIDAGVVVNGYTDGYKGAAPDQGAYESGGFRWSAGTNGIGSDQPGIFNTGAAGITINAAWLTGSLVKTDAVPVEVVVYWGTRDGSTTSNTWQNHTSMGSNAVSGTTAFSLGVSNLIAGATYFFRYYQLDASSSLWATSSMSFLVTNVTNIVLSPTSDVQIDPVEWTSSGGPSGDTQNTNPNNDIISSTGTNLNMARIGVTGGDIRSFLKFNLSGISNNTPIMNATLRLYLEATEPYGGGQLRRVTARDWTVSNVVYGLGSASNSAGITNFASTTGASSEVPPALGWYEMNVKSAVTGWVGGAVSNYGFVLLGVEGYGGTGRRITSSRGTASQRPQLVISRQAFPIDNNGNGLPDAWEAWAFGGTNQPNGSPTDDWDHDGALNQDEYLAGTDPCDPSSCFRLSAVSPPSGNGVTLIWNSVSGKTYSIDRAMSLNEGWIMPSLTSGVPADVSGTNQFTDPAPSTNTAFYRVRTTGS